MTALVRADEREILEGVVVSTTPNPALVRPGQGRISTGQLWEMLLRDKRSLKTREAYEGDLKHHYLTFREGTARFPRELLCTRDEIIVYLDAFISWPRTDIAFRMGEYKALMLDGQFAEATVARRLSATKSLLRLAYRWGRCETDGRGLVDMEKVRAYRQTHGITVEQITQLFALPTTAHGLNSVMALRDEGMLRLMGQSGLRRAEVINLDIGDFSLATRTVRVLGKGRGTQKEMLRVSPKAATAIASYLQETGRLGERDAPLFVNLDRNPQCKGKRLSERAVNDIVGDYGTRLGIELRPHMLRHTFGTQLSIKSGGDVPAVQTAMRHADANTTVRYIENAKDLQGQQVDLLTEVYD